MQTCRTAGTSTDSGIFMPAGLAEHNHRKPAHTQRGNCMYRSETHTALKKNILYFLRWTAISIVMGTVCGLIGTAFGYGVIYAQRLFKTHSFMLYLMPVAGVLIVLLHQMFHEIGNRGTNLILESISSDERIPMCSIWMSGIRRS